MPPTLRAERMLSAMMVTSSAGRGVASAGRSVSRMLASVALRRVIWRSTGTSTCQSCSRVMPGWRSSASLSMRGMPEACIHCLVCASSAGFHCLSSADKRSNACFQRRSNVGLLSPFIRAWGWRRAVRAHVPAGCRWRGRRRRAACRTRERRPWPPRPHGLLSSAEWGS